MEDDKLHVQKRFRNISVEGRRQVRFVTYQLCVTTTRWSALSLWPSEVFSRAELIEFRSIPDFLDHRALSFAMIRECCLAGIFFDLNKAVCFWKLWIYQMMIVKYDGLRAISYGSWNICIYGSSYAVWNNQLSLVFYQHFSPRIPRVAWKRF